MYLNIYIYDLYKYIFMTAYEAIVYYTLITNDDIIIGENISNIHDLY